MTTTAVPHSTPWDHHLIIGILFCSVLFGLLPSGFNWTVTEDNAALTTGSFAFQLQWGSLFLLSAWVVARHRALAMSHLRAANPLLMIMAIYCALGMVWSPVEMVTLKKTVQFAGLILIALAIQMNQKPWSHSMLVILSALTAIELASVVAALGFPTLGIDAYFGYAWRGIVSNKNTLGTIGALSLLLWIALWQVTTLRPTVRWLGIGLSVLCVVFSTSSTSITIAALSLITYGLLQRQHVGSRLWLQRVVVVIGLVILVMIHGFFIHEGRLPERSEILEPFAQLFGKSSDLTGRSDIWAPLYIEIEKHWLLGIGYGAFWLGPGSASQPILDSLPWIPYQAHNGYLDILNELGAVGIILFAGLVLSHMRSLGQLMRIDRQEAAMFSALLMMILVSNLTESSLFRNVVFDFLLLILSCVTVTSTLHQTRLRPVVDASQAAVNKPRPPHHDYGERQPGTLDIPNPKT